MRLLIALFMTFSLQLFAEDVEYEDVSDVASGRWGTADEESKYYKIVDLPIPEKLVIEAGCFDLLPDSRLLIGTRRGEVYFVSGAFEKKAEPEYHLFARGLNEIFGIAYRDNAVYVTQQCEVTRLKDTSGDGRADRFETVSDRWGYDNYHEYAFSSKFDKDGNMFVTLCLSKSYYSWELFRGWCLKVNADGKTVPVCSGLRSPCGVGENEHGVMMYAESQGPWNSSCSLKVLKQGAFMGHPASFNWYPHAADMGKAPQEPRSGSRVLSEMQKVEELLPAAVIFPYIRMGRSVSGFKVNRTKGKFGPFENQIFIGDYSQSLIMRATTEEVNGVWQGACYPFREGLSTGLLSLEFSPEGYMITGGTNRGWPVRGIKPFALERLEWTGVTPFEIKEINIRQGGFLLTFTKDVDSQKVLDTANYQVSSFTHIYHSAYGGPEVEKEKSRVLSASRVGDNQVYIRVSNLKKGRVYDFTLKGMRSRDGEKLLHDKAFYTVNEIPVK